MSRIGVLGGTFDPIHVGHLAAALAAMDCARLDWVLFVPSAQPPHRGAAVAPADDRLAMSRLAIEGEPRFEVSDLEVRRGGRSYTADTVAELRRLRPQDELFLILGWDAARLFRTWHAPQRVSSLATIVVVSRPGTRAPSAADLVTAGLDPDRVILCLNRTPDVSSSSLRRAIAAGQPAPGKLPVGVGDYIAAHRLYMDNRKS
ncbi:MAG: nicotinate-nucleotide adenylyltransferase [Candidatus Dormiibacterota bacterium]